jgi:hypothetical protein
MNGHTLKIVFMAIVGTLCFILIGSTVLVIMGKIMPEVWEKIIDKLGIVTLFGVICQSFLHADFNKDGIPDHQQIEKEKERV